MIRCPKCGKTYDVVAFEDGRTVKCSCGRKLDLSLLDTVEDFLRYFENEEELEKGRLIQKDAEVICQMILDEEIPEADIEIAKEKLLQKVQKLFPDKIQTYQLIYEARFKRLWEQFRN